MEGGVTIKKKTDENDRLSSNSRVQIYSTFICQVTSHGVNKQHGNHSIDFVICPHKRLKEHLTRT